MFKVKHGLVSEAFERIFVINNNFTKFHSKFDFCVPKLILNTFEKIEQDAEVQSSRLSSFRK